MIMKTGKKVSQEHLFGLKEFAQKSVSHRRKKMKLEKKKIKRCMQRIRDGLFGYFYGTR